MGRNRQQWRLQTRDVATNGITQRRLRYSMGIVTGKVSDGGWAMSRTVKKCYVLIFCRPTMIKYGIDNIRDMVGHKVNLQMVQDNPLCRLDKSPQ